MAAVGVLGVSLGEAARTGPLTVTESCSDVDSDGLLSSWGGALGAVPGAPPSTQAATAAETLQGKVAPSADAC